MNYTFLEYETYVFTILEDCFSGYEKNQSRNLSFLRPDFFLYPKNYILKIQNNVISLQKIF